MWLESYKKAVPQITQSSGRITEERNMQGSPNLAYTAYKGGNHVGLQDDICKLS
jgi:hypothetical protein